MCPEHSSQEPLTHVGISTLTHAGFISEVMSFEYPDCRIKSSWSGTGEPIGWNVSVNGGSTNVRLPYAALAVVIRLNGSVIVTGAVRFATIKLPSLQTLSA